MRRRDEPDYASYDDYLRDQGLCPVHMVCATARHPCVWCEMEKAEAEQEPEAE
jgi:hypothetical protein